MIKVNGGRIERARVALGGVGTVPWRSREAEHVLEGHAADAATFRRAAEAALKDAQPASENGFKVELAKRCIVRALTYLRSRHNAKRASLIAQEKIPMMFEEFVEFIGSQDGAPPKALDPNAPPPSAIIGAGVPRIDGPLKTTGTARYASDYNFPGLVYAVPVRATIASGKIRRIDSSAAEAMPGVLLVMHHGNIMPLYRNASRWTQQREPSSV